MLAIRATKSTNTLAGCGHLYKSDLLPLGRKIYLKKIQPSKKNVAPKILGKAGRKAKSEFTSTSSYDLVSDFSGDTYSKVEENMNVQKQQ